MLKTAGIRDALCPGYLPLFVDGHFLLCAEHPKIHIIGNSPNEPRVTRLIVKKVNRLIYTRLHGDYCQRCRPGLTLSNR